MVLQHELLGVLPVVRDLAGVVIPHDIDPLHEADGIVGRSCAPFLRPFAI